MKSLSPDQRMGSHYADRSGLAAVLEQHRPELQRFLTARCGNAAEAEDLMQELWLKTLRLPTGPIADGRAYLYRVANNLVLDRARGRRRALARNRHWLSDGQGDAPLADLPDPSLAADELISQEQEIARLHEAIAALPPGAREALRLFRIEERQQGEIAQIMGISRSGVEKHLALAMRHLRKSLGDCGLLQVAASEQRGALGEGPDPGQRP